eukprot:s1034_g1.t1
MARRDAIMTGDLPVCWPRGYSDANTEAKPAGTFMNMMNISETSFHDFFHLQHYKILQVYSHELARVVPFWLEYWKHSCLVRCPRWFCEQELSTCGQSAWRFVLALPKLSLQKGRASSTWTGPIPQLPPWKLLGE